MQALIFEIWFRYGRFDYFLMLYCRFYLYVDGLNLVVEDVDKMAKQTRWVLNNHIKNKSKSQILGLCQMITVGTVYCFSDDMILTQHII